MINYNDLQEKVWEAKRKIRESGGGTQHAMWDTVFDAECLIKGKLTILTEDQIIKDLNDFLNKN